jgi:hypothetical protein
MERKLRNRVLIFLLVAGIVAFVLVRMIGDDAEAAKHRVVNQQQRESGAHLAV